LPGNAHDLELIEAKAFRLADRSDEDTRVAGSMNRPRSSDASPTAASGDYGSRAFGLLPLSGSPLAPLAVRAAVALAARHDAHLSAVPAGFAEAREYYGPIIDGIKRTPDVEPAVVLVIIAWVIVTLAIIAWMIWLLLWRSRPAQSRVAANPRGAPASSRSVSTVA
jgi:hypothetical protein